MGMKDGLAGDFLVVVKDVHAFGTCHFHNFAGDVWDTSEELACAICIHFQKISEMLLGNDQSMAWSDLRNV